MRHYNRPVSAVLSLLILSPVNLFYESTVVVKSRCCRYIRTATELLMNYR